MTNYYLGCDVSKGYADFIILDSSKKIVEHVFQLNEHQIKQDKSGRTKCAS